MMNQPKILRMQRGFGSGCFLLIFHTLAVALPGSATEPAAVRIKAAQRAEVKSVRDVPYTPQIHCFVSCLDNTCPGPVTTTSSTTTSGNTVTITDTTTTGTGTTSTTGTTTTGTGTTTTATATTTTATIGYPDCIVSVSPYQPVYSPTNCSEIILYGFVAGCTTVAYRSRQVTFILEGLPSCFGKPYTASNDFSNHGLFPSPLIFTPVVGNTVVCDVGQGLQYSGSVVANDYNYNPPKKQTWNITIDTSGMEHCIGTYVSPLNTYCKVYFNPNSFRPTSCGRTDFARPALEQGCDYFHNFTVRYELSGFESCSAVQVVDGLLFFHVVNGKSCNVTSAQQHKGILKAFNSFNVETFENGAWETWEITLLTGGLLSCPPIWTGSVTTTTTGSSTSTITGTPTTTSTTSTTTF